MEEYSIIIVVYWIVGIIVSCIFGAVTKKINQDRGRQGGFWWGFFLNVIGIIIVALRPNDIQQTPTVVYVNKEDTPDPSTKKSSKTNVDDRPSVKLDNETLFSRGFNGACVVDRSKKYTICRICENKVDSGSTACPVCGAKFIDRSQVPQYTGDFTE